MARRHTFCVLIYALLISSRFINADNLVVNTANGKVVGEKRLNLEDKSEYYAFHAIPYASPPIGNLRFKPPKEISGTWKDTYNASDPNQGNLKKCAQKAFAEGLGGDVKNEDCLYLYVYTPSMSNATFSLPVVVWIHGGAYEIGSGSFFDYGPDLMMKGNDVVMVSINYRLGLLGFMSLGTSDVPGNMGLLDQVMALKWIKQNIKNFGGDPNMITIAGESAGSYSVLYHTLSPRSVGLFDRAIAQSGAPLSLSWHEYAPEIAIKWGQLAASSVGCDDGEAQVHCLQSVSVERLLKTSRGSGPNGAQAVVDGSFADFPFLPMSPREIMSSGAYNNNVSLLLGYNKDEGILHTADAYKNPAIVKKWKSKWTDEFGPSTLLGLKDQQINKNSKEISKKITKHYLGSVDGVSFENIGNITKMYTDAWFGYPVHEFVSRRLSNKGKIFYQNSTFQYQFTHQGQYSLTLFLGQGGPYGVAHADELFYMFSPFSSQNIVLNEDDKKMSNIILSLWKSFIKTGEPSTGKIIWDPILDSTSRQYLNLNLNSSMEYPDEMKSDMKFWDKIVIKLEDEKKKESLAQRQNKSNSNRTLPKNVVFALMMIFINLLR